MAKRKDSLIDFGFTKKLCRDDVNSTTDSAAASPAGTPPGVTTQEEAEEIMSSLPEDGGGITASQRQVTSLTPLGPLSPVKLEQPAVERLEEPIYMAVC